MITYFKHADDHFKHATHKMIEKACCDLLNLLDWVYTTSDASLTYSKGKVVGRKVGTSGWPDITAIYPSFFDDKLEGRLWGIEIKAKRDKLRPAQMEIRDRIQKAGGAFTTIRNPDELAEIFARYGYLKVR